MVRGEGGVYLFCGEEDFLKEEASRKIISSLLGPESKKLNCDIYNAKEDCPDIFNTLDTLPLLAGKRVVVIKEVEHLAEPQKKFLLTYLKAPHKHICLILESSQIPSNHRFIKTISPYARTHSFRRFRPWELRGWIQKRLNQYKKAITKEGLDLLLELKGNESLTLLWGELEKLVTYKGQEKTITKEDVVELVGKSLAKRTFDLIEAVNSKDRDSALLLAHELSSGKSKVIPEVMGLMGWQLRKLWRSNRLSKKELKEDFKLLVEADRSIKSGRHRPKFILEELVMKLCSR